jgi:hypothetical protein
MDPIIPVIRKDPFDDPAWSYELKYDDYVASDIAIEFQLERPIGVIERLSADRWNKWLHARMLGRLGRDVEGKDGG